MNTTEIKPGSIYWANHPKYGRLKILVKSKSLLCVDGIVLLIEKNDPDVVFKQFDDISIGLSLNFTFKESDPIKMCYKTNEPCEYDCKGFCRDS